MEKFISMVLAIMCVLSLVACDDNNNSIQYADELIDKYKRSDIDELKEKPSNFLDDMVGVFLNAKSEKFENGWWKDEEKNDSYRVEAVVFDVPAIIMTEQGDIDIDGEKASNIILCMIAVDKRHDIAKSICEFAFETYGDACAILDEKDSDITEFELRTGWEDEDFEYSILWVTSSAEIMIGYNEQFIAIMVAEDIGWAKSN